MNITLMICARGGSKSVPWKNKLSPFKDQNIYERLHEKIKKASSDKLNLIVNTDNREIEILAKSAGLSVFKRNEKLGLDISRIVEVNYQYKMESGDNFDYLVNLSPVAPFLKISTISKTLEIIRNLKPQCGGTASKHQNNSHPFLAMHKEGENSKYLLNEKIRYPRQSRKETFYANGCIFFREANLIRGDKISNDLTKKYTPIFIDEIESLNIDSIQDWEIAKLIASSNKFNCYH